MSNDWLFVVALGSALLFSHRIFSSQVALWADYVAGWTACNHVRTAAALAASASLAIGSFYQTH